MKELVEYVARGLVEHPDRVSVVEIPEGGGLIYELEVAPEDMGKVIGRQGRMINALRTLVKAAAVRRGVRVNVEVV
ncbi:MAG TPA: KH domain-containing protein [Chloroflexota bacterium]|nr:KH domain-containing protein [Chloroflexota bacterium]